MSMQIPNLDIDLIPRLEYALFHPQILAFLHVILGGVQVFSSKIEAVSNF